MRSDCIASLFAAASLLAACGSSAEAEVPVPVAAGSAPTVVAAGAPHGGTVVTAGDHQVEVVPQNDGTVHAFMVGEAPAPEGTRMTVRVMGDDGQQHPVVLVWDPGQARYVGRMRRARPAPGPVDVDLQVRGRRHRGHAPQVVVIAPSRPAVHVVAPSRPAVVVHDPRPTVVVHDPRPTVVVHHPAPAVVVAPTPVVVVGRHDNGLHRGHYKWRGGHGHGGGHFRGGHGGPGRVRVRVH